MMEPGVQVHTRKCGQVACMAGTLYLCRRNSCNGLTVLVMQLINGQGRLPLANISTDVSGEQLHCR